MKKIFFVSLLGIMILIPLVTLAADKGLGSALGNLETVNQDTGLKKELAPALGTVIKTALSLVGTVFLGLMIYAGILWMIAQGKEEKVTKAKDMITAAIIGLAITMSAYAITYFVTAKLTGVVGGGGGDGDGGGGGGGSTLSDQSCKQQGGLCLSKEEDPEGNCDPDGVGADDPYSGTALGVCEDNQGLCCDLKDSLEKCERTMGGTCRNVGSCPAGEVQLGDNMCGSIVDTKQCCRQE